MRGFFQQMTRRRVWRAGGAYLVLAWLIVQIGSVVFPALGFPMRAQTALILSLAALFPVVVALAWKYEFRSGRVRPTPAEAPARPVSTAGHVLELGIIAALCLMVVALIWGRSLSLWAFSGPPVPAASVAVMPFLDMSEGGDQGFFADGVAEEILNELAQSRDLKVAARTSSFTFRDQEQDVRVIGEALGVRNVLEGSVRRSGNMVRVTAQLVDARTGFHLWSETYEQPASDIFWVQDEIASAVRRELEVALLGGAAATANLEAYELYLKAIEDIRLATPESFSAAVAGLEQAIEIAPGYPEPYAALAMVLRIMTVGRRGGLTQAEYETRSEALIVRALALDPDLPEAHLALGVLRMEQNRWDEALRAIDESLSLRPNFVRALQYRSETLTAMGRVADAWASIEQAKALDPLNPLVVADWASFLPLWGREAEARAMLQPWLDDPQYAVPAHAYLMAVENTAGDLAGMHAAALSMQALIGEVPALKSHKAMIYFHLGLGEPLAAAADGMAPDRLYAALASGDADAVRAAAQALIAADEGEPDSARMLAGGALIHIRDFEGACAALAPLLNEAAPGTGPLYDSYSEARAIDLALCRIRSGDTAGGRALLGPMRRQIARFRAEGITLPSIDYMEARIAALEGEDEAALTHLARAMEGRWPWNLPSQDPAFDALRNNPAFAAAEARCAAGLEAQRAAVAAQLAQMG